MYMVNEIISDDKTDTRIFISTSPISDESVTASVPWQIFSRRVININMSDIFRRCVT